MQLQQTLTRNYSFEGKGLHTGKTAKMVVMPAPVDTGIVFRRVDLDGCPEVDHVVTTVRKVFDSSKTAIA